MLPGLYRQKKSIRIEGKKACSLIIITTVLVHCSFHNKISGAAYCQKKKKAYFAHSSGELKVRMTVLLLLTRSSWQVSLCLSLFLCVSLLPIADIYSYSPTLLSFSAYMQPGLNHRSPFSRPYQIITTSQRPTSTISTHHTPILFLPSLLCIIRINFQHVSPWRTHTKLFPNCSNKVGQDDLHSASCPSS